MAHQLRIDVLQHLLARALGRVDRAAQPPARVAGRRQHQVLGRAATRRAGQESGSRENGGGVVERGRVRRFDETHRPTASLRCDFVEPVQLSVN